jgi:hypothetical protein
MKIVEAVQLVNELCDKGKYDILCRLKAAEVMVGALKEKYPANKKCSIIMKHEALKSLYGINRIPKKDVNIWIETLVDFLQGKKKREEQATIEWIDKITGQFKRNVGNARKKNGEPRCQPSFLSKFFHFFVKDGENEIPVFDTYACLAASRIVENTKGLKEKFKEGSTKNKKELGDYKWHAMKVLTIQRELRKRKEFGLREIDRFLWIAGHYWDKKKPKPSTKVTSDKVPPEDNWKKMFEKEKKLTQLLDKLKNLE